MTTHDVHYAETGHRDRLRSAIPTFVSFVLLFAVTVAGALVVREVVELGMWLAVPQ